MNKMQLALIRKDIRSITANKQLFMVMLVVPLVLTVVIPTIFILITTLVPETDPDFQQILKLLPIAAQDGDLRHMVLGMLFNRIMPIFFLVIPTMASSVMAASSFVGEKEKHTLETLLYSPLSLRQLFQAKILAGFSVGMLVSLVSFTAMLLVVETELFLLTGAGIVPDLGWLFVMLLLAPAISIAAIAITVRSSAKAQTMEEAQQRAVFLVFPILALIIGQVSGLFLLSPLLFFALGVLSAGIAALLMKGVAGKFTYEAILK